ncbi:MAG: general secretion pathway protein GspB [Arenimonas sp.]
MSLILDALKKSEAERQRGQVPNLLSPLPSTPSHAQADKKSSLPLLASIALLAAALVAGYFYMGKTAPEPVSIPTTPASPVPVEASATQAVDNELPTTPAMTESKPVPAEKPLVAEVAPDKDVPTPTQVITESPPPQTTAEEVTESESEPRVASMAEMPVDQRQQLPALKLSMHVYSSEPGKRFAIIDGQRVNEGSVLGTAVVEKIRQDGVVLSVQGQSYLLPRP